MRCGKAKKLIYLLLEEDLEQREKEDLLEHMESCRACSLEWEEAKRSHLYWKATLLGEGLPQISEGEFAEGITRRIEEQKEPVKVKPARSKVFSLLDAHRKTAYVAAVVILAFISLWLGFFSKGGKEIPKKEVVVHSAFINDKEAAFSISESEDHNIVFIWLEKS